MEILSAEAEKKKLKLEILKKIGGFSGPNVGKYVNASSYLIIGFILILLSYYSSWYTYELTVTNNGVNEFTFKSYPNKAVILTSDDNNEDHDTTSWDKSGADSNAEIFSVIHIITIILIFLCLISAIMISLYGVFPLISKKGIGIALCALILVISHIGPLIMIIYLPDAYHSDFSDLEDELHYKGPWSSFWDSDSGATQNEGEYTEFDHNWGPSFGWYFSMIGGWFCLIGGIIALKAVNSDENLPQIRKIEEMEIQGQSPMLSQQINVAGQTGNERQLSFGESRRGLEDPSGQIGHTGNRIFCAACGREHVAGDKFCSSCGNLLKR